jgi:hypothetical protein
MPGCVAESEVPILSQTEATFAESNLNHIEWSERVESSRCRSIRFALVDSAKVDRENDPIDPIFD